MQVIFTKVGNYVLYSFLKRCNICKNDHFFPETGRGQFDISRIQTSVWIINVLELSKSDY